MLGLAAIGGGAASVARSSGDGENAVWQRGAPPENQMIFTVGHSTRAIDDFIGLLRDHGVTRLIDVRTVPKSRHNPQFNRDELPKSLATARIGYAHLPELGGLRRAVPDSLNTAWRNLS